MAVKSTFLEVNEIIIGYRRSDVKADTKTLSHDTSQASSEFYYEEYKGWIKARYSAADKWKQVYLMTTKTSLSQDHQNNRT